MSFAVSPDPVAETSPLPEPEPAVPRHVAKHLIHGTSALGLGVMIERGMGFLANILAARLGGATTFGTYSLAYTTAASISTYAAGGIGATAARFSGKYPRGGPGYSTLSRVLLIVSLVSAGAAALGLVLGAAPIAHLLRKDSLTEVLRWAAFSSAGIILLECARGFFVGQRRLMALVLLSVIVGIGMVTLLPIAAAHGNPIRMIICQGAITTVAVIICLSLARPLGLLAPRAIDEQTAGAPTIAPLAFGPMLKEVWSFGLVQLAGLIGMNLAGWWVTSLVARSDTTLVQISFLAIANQLRNIVGLAPSLLTESSYATMSDSHDPASRPEEDAVTTPDRVMALCTYASTSASLLLSSIGILIVPWGLSLLYGKTYGAAAATTAIGLAIAVVHMGNAPAAARLTIVSIRTTGIINTIWAIFVGAAGTAFLLHGGSASKAMAIYLAGHVVSASLVWIALKANKSIPRGMTAVVVTGTLTGVVLALLSYIRSRNSGQQLEITGAMTLVAVAGLWILFLLGKRHHWLPSPTALRRLTTAVTSRISNFLPRRGHLVFAQETQATLPANPARKVTGESVVTWQLLQVSDVLDREFGSALGEDVSVLGWRPETAYFPWMKRGSDQFVDDPPLHIRSFPLAPGYWRFPISAFAGLGGNQIRRMKKTCAFPEKTPLICTTPYCAAVAEGWPGPVVYHLTDLMAAYQGAAVSLVHSLDARMCRAATLVCPNSTRIADYLIEHGHCDADKIVVLPNATRESNLMREPPHEPGELPPDVHSLPRPIAGVIGNLAGNMDWILLESLVRKTPEFHWVFVGPVSMQILDAAQSAARDAVIKYGIEGARVHFVGLKPYGELARYARSFDVAVLPYLRREPTFSGSSTRFYEHLAACRPMLATRGFEELLHKEPLLRLVDTSDEAAQAMEQLRSAGFDDGLTVERWSASRQGTWRARARTMQHALSMRLPGAGPESRSR